MSIQPLPEDVIAQIKSSTTITSLNGVVCGLFKNSLDAGATKITVKIDYARGNCSVEDNGAGLLPTEFASGGGLGKLHCTLDISKTLHYVARKLTLLQILHASQHTRLIMEAVEHFWHRSLPSR